MSDFRKRWKTDRRPTAADHALDDVAGKPVLISCRFDRDGERRVLFLSALSIMGLKDNERTRARTTEIKRMASAFKHDDLVRAPAL